MRKQPQITERTKALFIEAFWILYRDNPVGQIKIGELSSRAGYNRSTFYEYFTDIYDLLHQAEDELINEFKKTALEKFPNGVNGESNESIIRALVEIFDLLGDKLFLIIGENGDPSFQSKLRAQVKPFLQLMSGRNLGKYSDYVSTYSFSGAMGILKYWHENGQDITKEEVISLLVSMMAMGCWQL